MDLQTIITLITGPVGALALCVSVIYFVGRWAATHVPQWVNRHLDQIDRIVESHNDDRKVYQTSFEQMYGDVKTIKSDVQTIKHAVNKQAPPNPTAHDKIQ